MKVAPCSRGGAHCRGCVSVGWAVISSLGLLGDEGWSGAEAIESWGLYEWRCEALTGAGFREGVVGAEGPHQTGLQ